MDRAHAPGPHRAIGGAAISARGIDARASPRIETAGPRLGLVGPGRTAWRQPGRARWAAPCHHVRRWRRADALPVAAGTIPGRLPLPRRRGGVPRRRVLRRGPGEQIAVALCRLHGLAVTVARLRGDLRDRFGKSRLCWPDPVCWVGGLWRADQTFWAGQPPRIAAPGLSRRRSGRRSQQLGKSGEVVGGNAEPIRRARARGAWCGACLATCLGVDRRPYLVAPRLLPLRRRFHPRLPYSPRCFRLRGALRPAPHANLAAALQTPSQRAATNAAVIKPQPGESRQADRSEGKTGSVRAGLSTPPCPSVASRRPPGAGRVNVEGAARHMGHADISLRWHRCAATSRDAMGNRTPPATGDRAAASLSPKMGQGWSRRLQGRQTSVRAQSASHPVQVYELESFTPGNWAREAPPQASEFT